MVLDFKTTADEAAYAAWVERHPAGFIINAAQLGRSRMMLHRARCTHIQSAPGWPAVTAAKHKICGEDPDELEAWAGARSAPLDCCRSCDPLPGRPHPERPAKRSG